MLDILRRWLDRFLGEEEAVILLLLLLAGLLLVTTLGGVLAPVIAGALLAFMMQGVVAQLVRWRVAPLPALAIAFLLFVGGFLLLLLFVMPLAWNQLASLVSELPRMVDALRGTLLHLPEKYPTLLSEQQARELIETGSRDIARLGQSMLSASLSYLPGFIGLLVYAVIVPLLVFFFLKDRELILQWLASWLPANRPGLSHIWREMDLQLANYIRGKGVEILVVGGVSVLTFALFGLQYALLLGSLVGLSVIIPYVGAVVVTVPVAVVAYFQWGWAAEFGYLMAAYLVIQVLDGNVLVPLLFSEANSLHPVAIILAVLVFGSVWGVWGAFFAIPLATLLKAIINAWPVRVAVPAAD